ncbi:hypothetical protein [Tenacibaculum xiamenense]|uniref:hypothetical protein n=1 Tax=Tenacibaculum xiamenense TaxID=1261553 RepID=UPI00389607A9
MKQLILVILLLHSFLLFSQNIDDSKLLMLNPYFIESSPNFTLDTIPNRIEGQVIDYSNKPLPTLFFTMEDKNGVKTIHYCNSKGKFFIPKNLINGSKGYVKLGCCISDTIKIDSNINFFKIKFQVGPDCLKKSGIQNCNPIQKDQFYVNYMLTDVPYYIVQLGSEILNSSSAEIMFYTLIDPYKTYRNNYDKKFKGRTLIKLKKLPFTEWNEKLFYPE